MQPPKTSPNSWDLFFLLYPPALSPHEPLLGKWNPCFCCEIWSHLFISAWLASWSPPACHQFYSSKLRLACVSLTALSQHSQSQCGKSAQKGKSAQHYKTVWERKWHHASLLLVMIYKLQYLSVLYTQHSAREKDSSVSDSTLLLFSVSLKLREV